MKKISLVREVARKNIDYHRRTIRQYQSLPILYNYSGIGFIVVAFPGLADLFYCRWRQSVSPSVNIILLRRSCRGS